MSKEFNNFQSGIRRQTELERKGTIRRPITLARRAEAGVDHQQLSIKIRIPLRITEAENGADEEDIGKFWFVPGYSVVGGPDIVPEE